jgi:phosphatidylglycerophosphate synthase
VHRVQAGPLIGFAGVLVLLGVLDVAPGIDVLGWKVGVASGIALCALLGRALARRSGDERALGPADRITLFRAVLVCGVAALSVGGGSTAQVATLTVLAAIVLVLDGVDGAIARRTRTASALGARFDMEVDAFLILVLSGYVARSAGWWVLLIGAARYLFVAAGWARPWLRGTAPPRPWCKVVAVVQGVVLTVASADVIPVEWIRFVLAVALVLLAESFGREAWELWRLRRTAAPAPVNRPVLSTAVTVLAGVLVWFALVVPDRVRDLTPGAFVRIPLEGLVLVVLALVLRPRLRRGTAVGFGVVLGVLLLVKALDMGFYTVFDRRLDPLNDWYYVGPGVGVLGDSIGHGAAVAVAVGVVLLAVAVVAFVCLAVVRVTRVATDHRSWSARAVTALGLVWVVCAVTGVQVASGATVAARSTADLAFGQIDQLRADLADRRVFAKDIAEDSLADTPDDQFLAGLRGKDVLLVLVESYGRVAVQGSTFSPGVDAVLDEGTQRLRASGYSTRSAFLTSPTFGAGSWLAHSTLQSGLWVNSQQRYNQLVTQSRLTLTGAFGRAGWRTVFGEPANTHDWPEGEHLYGFDKLYDSRNVGYRGPKFGYATMPDQYTLAALGRSEFTTDPDRPRVMAEVNLLSSHHPWTPLPRLVPWADVGDGSVFDGMPAEGVPESVAYRDPDKVRALYGQSIEYTMSTLVSWLETVADRDLVLVVLGDHQPHHYVSGDHPGHDVPITVIARDPAVADRISGWGWQDGLRPAPDAPIWRMDTFRDRFLTTFATAR